MSERTINGIDTEGFKTLEEVKELLQGMTREELAALTAMLNFRTELLQKKRIRQHSLR